MKLIVLASSSARRKALLRQLGLKFVVAPSLIEERLNPRLKPRGQAEALALQKAEAVAEKYSERKNHGSFVVVAADTIVSIDGEILSKPKNEKEAIKMLTKLSGGKHRVITGFSIIDMESKRMVNKSVETIVYFRKLTNREIREYVKKERVMDKSGAYAAQGMGVTFIEKIEGDYFNVVGLPLYTLALELKKFGISVL